MSTDPAELRRLAVCPSLDGGVASQAMLAAADKIERQQKLIEKLHIIAKNVSHALMSFTPGGSEYFTRVQVGDFEDYYADADVCQRRTRERIDRAEDAARRMAAEINKASVRLNGRGGEVIEVRPLVAEKQTEAK